MTVKDTIASCLVIALGAILALHFALFWLYGGVFIHETNKVILTIETVMSITIIVFGIERLASSASLSRPRQASSSHQPTREQYMAKRTSSPVLVRDPQATAPAYTAATAVTANSDLLFGSDASNADSCTQDVCDSIECDSSILVRLTQMEHEPTMATGNMCSPTLHR